MAFPKATIRLDAARVIFQGVDIQEITAGGEVCAYRATLRDGTTFENKSLTKLCAGLWQAK